jgi:hypothetical protein
MIELTGDAKVIAFIQSALPDLNNERQITLERTLFSLIFLYYNAFDYNFITVVLVFSLSLFLSANSTPLSPTSPRQKPAIPPRPHRPSLALSAGIDSKTPPPEPPPKVVQVTERMGIVSLK